MNQDKYDEIINGEQTYKTIALKLKFGIPVLIGWTDEFGTHLDILFTNGAYKEKYNMNQMGLKADDIFVSVMGIGSFGFYRNDEDVSPDYIGEKLNLNGKNETTEKLAELINNIKKELIELYKKGDNTDNLVLKNLINRYPELPLVFFSPNEEIDDYYIVCEKFDCYVGTVWFDETHDRFYDDFDEICADYGENYLVDDEEFSKLKDKKYDEAVERYVESYVTHYKAIIIKLCY